VWPGGPVGPGPLAESDGPGLGRLGPGPAGEANIFVFCFNWSTSKGLYLYIILFGILASKDTLCCPQKINTQAQCSQKMSTLPGTAKTPGQITRRQQETAKAVACRRRNVFRSSVQ
jgi:hypothetical protein